MSRESSPKPNLRARGVYRIEHDGRAPEFLVALVNEESPKDYSYALARRPYPGRGLKHFLDPRG